MYHKQRWTPEKIAKKLNLIAPLVYINRQPLPPFRHCKLPDAVTRPPAGPGVDDSAWAQLVPNSYWGGWLQNFTLRATFAIPADWDETHPVALYLPLGDAHDFCHPEALIYINGAPYAACDRHHQEILLKPEWRDGREHLLALHGWTGLGDFPRGDPFTQLYLRECALVQIHQPTRDFLALAGLALESLNALDTNNPAKHRLLTNLDLAFNALDTREPLGQDKFYASLETATRLLQDGIAASGPPLDVVIHASGHAHIDVAWLWTLAQTRRKCERTFHTVIRLMEQFPDYHFTQSQPQLYQFIKEDQPELFESIKQRVSEGRWEPLGGMWVEADCNLSGAESLARQFLLGRAFFREHFGPQAESPVLWLPDVFGYAWALPQLIRQAGLEYFMTTKIGWSQYNRLPFDTFLWQGLDGTKILTHFSTVAEIGSPYASTYNAMANAKEALGAWQNFQQKELHSDLLMAYGFGDGGGGPTREMLENIENMARFPALPQVRQSSVKTFFDSIAPLAESKMMPVWDGELYLEYHRGTYTTQARTKRANRKSEFLLHDAEFLAALAALECGTPYPAEQFRQAWQIVCLNQFHDILPGSSIAEVYAEAEAQYKALAANITRLRDEALQALSQRVDGDILLVNPTSFTQTGLVFIPGDSFQRITRDGQPVPVQEAESGLWADVGELPPYSLTALTQTERLSPQQLSPPGEKPCLENDFLRVEFNPAGDIVRIFDKRCKREVLPAGALANQLQAFEDRPKDWDAWDIEIYYDDKMWLPEPAESMVFVEYGPLRQTLEIRRKILNSDYTQRVSLNVNSPRLDFDTHINWQERHILLKAAFPVEVLAPQATYEIQWGNVTRPTHRNTSWDWARFETCAHKWVDLSEGDYGVSLLNDCKYGHDIHGNLMRISLLRSTTKPDPLADAGEHHFTYSLYPHPSGWDEATQREAYGLNDPVIVFRVRGKSPAAAATTLGPLVSVDAPNVVVETVKQAEDGDGIIVRLYESQRKRGQVRVRMGRAVEAAWETNLLEENQAALGVENASIFLNLRPYQIVTLRVRLKR